MSNSLVLETAVLAPSFVRVLSTQNESESKKEKGLSRKLLEPLPCADTSQEEIPNRRQILGGGHEDFTELRIDSRVGLHGILTCAGTRVMATRAFLLNLSFYYFRSWLLRTLTNEGG